MYLRRCQLLTSQQQQLLLKRWFANKLKTKPSVEHEVSANTVEDIPRQNVTGKPMVTAEVSKSKVTNYALNKYVTYVDNYDSVLQRRFPKAMQVYRVFSVGIKEFYYDIKSYIRIAGTVHRNGYGTLTRKDLEIYEKMPRDMLKMLPVLLVSALPFANYVVFPLAFMFPRALLSSHFWSIQQRTDFADVTLKKKLRYHRPVFRCLQRELETISDTTLQNNCAVVLSKLGSGTHPEVEEILSIQELFSNGPYRLDRLHSSHVNGLLKIHGLRAWLFRRRKLHKEAIFIRLLDKAMHTEGITNLSHDDLKSACYRRGLNPVHMRTDDMMLYLTQWLAISDRVDGRSSSLLLHCPILLAYNHPTNWGLLH